MNDGKRNAHILTLGSVKVMGADARVVDHHSAVSAAIWRDRGGEGGRAESSGRSQQSVSGRVRHVHLNGL